MNRSPWRLEEVNGSPWRVEEVKYPATRVSQEAKSVFGSIAPECAASVVGSIHPSSDGAICSGSRAGVPAGGISRTLSVSRTKSCLS